MNNLTYRFLLCVSLFIFYGCIDGSKKKIEKKNVISVTSQPWSERMADSEISRLGPSIFYGNKKLGEKWNYQTGLFLKSLLDLWQATNEQKYYDYVVRVMDSFINEDGSIKTYNMDEYNMDNINSGKVLLRLYEITKADKYKKAAFSLRQQLESQPRTKEGGFWHKKKYPWQMWLDGIYMGDPFYAEYSKLFDEPKGFDDVADQILIIDVHTRDPKTGLRYHGWDESNKQKWADPVTGCSPNFWGRGMGWYAMALVDVLDYLPENHDKRQKIIFILNDLIKSIAKYQDQDSGVWYQVVDQGNRKGNYLESSASCMYVYAIAKAVRMKYVDPKYQSVAEKGYEGIIKEFVEIDSTNQVNLTHVCSVAGLGGDPYRDGSYEYYISEPVVNNDLKGVGPFIMASIEMEKKTPAKKN